MKQFAFKQFGVTDSQRDEVSLVGLSQFDLSQQCSLDSHYEYKGRGVTYNGEAKQVMIIDQTSVVSQDDSTTEVETLVVMVRRYGSSAVVRPAAGDVLVLRNDAGVDSKKYKLTQVPSEAFNHLEWELRLSRTKTVRRGGSRVLPVGGA
ncbi:MAG: hypothetical protein ABJZ55_20420 [Fuerstiella sp.]